MTGRKQGSALRIGVIGLGRIGWDFHCGEIARQRAFQLVGVADAMPERCREATDKLGVAAFADYRELLRTVPMDAVTIASPTHLHAPMAREALRRDLHVLLEKPMALHAREAALLVREAARRQRILTVYQPHRLAAYFQQVRRIIASGVIGQVYHVRRGLFSFSQRNDWQSLQRYGGGMLANFGAHALDQVLQLIGYDVARLFCRCGRVASVGDAEDVVKIVIETRAGVLGEVDINQACTRNLYELEVIGTTGVIALRDKALEVRTFRPAQLKRPCLDGALASADRRYPAGGVAISDKVVPVDARLGLDLYADFARAIRDGRPPAVTPAEALTLMRLLDRCRKASGEIVVTPIRRTKHVKDGTDA